jgi:hypothetical protein
MIGLDDVIMAVSMISTLTKLYTKLILSAEYNEGLPSGDCKHKSVAIDVERFIDEQDDLHPHIKGELKRGVNPTIKEIVEVFNNKGIFVRSRK